MALQQAYTDPTTQIQASYWDISSLLNDVTNNVTDCTLSLYASQTARANGASPIHSIDFTIPGVLAAADCFNYIIANYPTFLNAVIV